MEIKNAHQSRDFCCDEALKLIVNQEYARKADGFITVLFYKVFFEKSSKVNLIQ